MAACAALLHDLGHGPFSHAFEGAEKKRERKKSHEEWTAELIKGDTEVCAVLDKSDKSLADDVARMISQKEPEDIYAAVVSSQFDADRLDYLQRDRYMTGARSGGFDFDWLLDCLRVGSITIGVKDEEDYVEVDSPFLSFKGLHAAEGYLLARYHLYLQIYMHKTTRGSEQILGALLHQLSDAINDGDFDKCGINQQHPLARYLLTDGDTLQNYLSLDDAVIWSALSQICCDGNSDFSNYAKRLTERHICKCIDAGAMAEREDEGVLIEFKKVLRDFNEDRVGDIYQDLAKVSAYGKFEFDDPEALEKVLIQEKGSDRPQDIERCSKIVKAIPTKDIFRVYVTDQQDYERVNKLWEGVKS